MRTRSRGELNFSKAKREERHYAKKTANKGTARKAERGVEASRGRHKRKKIEETKRERMLSAKARILRWSALIKTSR
jgi:hypothetical protein